MCSRVAIMLRREYVTDLEALLATQFKKSEEAFEKEVEATEKTKKTG